MVYWQRYYRLGSHTRQLRFDNPDGFFRGQPPRLDDDQTALESYQQALAIVRETDDRSKAVRILNNIGRVYERQNQYPQALESYKQGLAVARDVGDREGAGNILNNMGLLYQRQKQYAKARELYEQALPMQRDAQDREGEGITLDNIGTVYRDLGEYAKALPFHQQAVVLLRQVDAHSDQAIALGNLGYIYDNLGRYEDALKMYRQALVIHRKLGDRKGEAAVLQRSRQVYDHLLDQVKEMQPEEALESLNRVLALSQGAADRFGEVRAHIGIGQIHERIGQYSKAREHYEQALAVGQVAGYRQVQASALNNIGLIHKKMGQYHKAMEFFEQALAIAREVRDRGIEAVNLTNIAGVYQDLGQFAKSLEFYPDALTTVREMHNRPGEGTILSSMGTAYQHLGQYSKALDLDQQALAIAREVHDRALEAVSLYDIAVIHLDLGQYAEAQKMLEQALAMARRMRGRVEEERAILGLAVVYERLAQYPKSLDLYQQALTIQRELGERAQEGVTLNNVGTVYRHLAQYPKALEFFEQALAIRREVGDRQGESVTLANIGSIYDDLGQPKALEAYQEALVIQREIGDRAGEAATLQGIGAVYTKLGDYSKALDFLGETLAVVQQIGLREGEGPTRNAIGFVYGKLGRHQEALESYREALAISRELGDRPMEGTALYNIGMIYDVQGEWRQALDFYLQSIAVKESVRTSARLEELKTGLAEQAVHVYERAIVLLLDTFQPNQAFDLSERARARGFLDHIGNTRLDIRKGADAALIQQEQALRLELTALDGGRRQERGKPGPQQNAELIQVLTTQLTAKQQQYEDFLTRLKLANPEYASLVSVKPLQFSEVQRLLDKDTTLLSYFTMPDKTLGFVVSRDALVAFELPVGEKELDATIGWFRGFSDSPSPSLKQLYGWLIAPLKSLLKTRFIGIIPYGVLHYVPFAALTDGRRSLGDEYTIFHLPSASALQFLQQKRKGGRASVLAVAQGQAEGLPPLQYAEQEARAIAKLYKATPLVGGAATESAVVARARDVNILHLAAHGQLNPVNPLFSRIVLAPGGDADGLLEVHEIYGLDLAKASLIVLSACQTQMGAQSRGDDVVGLSRAFIYAGAPTVIASLWKVDDKATSYLMTSLYTNLKKRMGKAAALWAAQAKTRAKYPDPYYWAAFVLMGEPGTRTP